MKAVRFLTSGAGRAARVVLGLVILSAGLLAVRSTIGTVMAIVALVPIAGGLLDFCLLGYALGYPLSGAQARKKLAGT